MSVISSLSNPKIKEAVKLRDGKHRRRFRRFLIDGLRELDRAVQCGIRILDIFTVHSGVSYPDAEVHQVSGPVMQKLAFGNRNEGIVALAVEPEQSFATFESQTARKFCPLFAVLEGIEKPGNLGAVFRSADAAGIDGILIADPLVDPFHSNAIRNSMGTVFSIPTVCESALVIKKWLIRRGIQIASAWCAGGSVPYTSVDFCNPTAVVLGSEADGLDSKWNGSGITVLTIPMLGIADSLNISVAAGILFYEARRQRGPFFNL